MCSSRCFIFPKDWRLFAVKMFRKWRNYVRQPNLYYPSGFSSLDDWTPHFFVDDRQLAERSASYSHSKMPKSSSFQNQVVCYQIHSQLFLLFRFKFRPDSVSGLKSADDCSECLFWSPICSEYWFYQRPDWRNFNDCFPPN